METMRRKTFKAVIVELCRRSDRIDQVAKDFDLIEINVRLWFATGRDRQGLGSDDQTASRSESTLQTLGVICTDVCLRRTLMMMPSTQALGLSRARDECSIPSPAHSSRLNRHSRSRSPRLHDNCFSHMSKCDSAGHFVAWPKIR